MCLLKKPGDRALVKIQPAKLSDLDAFYVISLVTGDRGTDASHLYEDPHLLAHIYSAPYLMLCPELCVVAEDGKGVAGYAVGALSTRDFDMRLEKKWWPGLRAKYAAPELSDRQNWSADQHRIQNIHHPHKTPPSIVSEFPSHLHLNLHPRLHRQGIGPKLLGAWVKNAKNRGSTAAHVGVNAHNENGLRFWMENGFKPITGNYSSQPNDTRWLGRQF